LSVFRVRYSEIISIYIRLVSTADIIKSSGGVKTFMEPQFGLKGKIPISDHPFFRKFGTTIYWCATRAQDASG